MSVQKDVASAIVPIIEADGNYLEEVKIVNAGKRKLITVIVDGDSYLNLDQVASISRSISETLENLPALGDGAFTLEVTSPGIDRPLTLPRHWKKNIGKLVKVELNDGTQVEGRIAEINGEKISLEDSVMDIKNVKKANLQKELDNLTKQITNPNDHGTDDTAGTFKLLEDGSETLMKEEAGQLATRQKKFIEQLENALVRIENKTYGICRVTGKLIPKERLRGLAAGRRVDEHRVVGP